MKALAPLVTVRRTFFLRKEVPDGA
jgi:hypothetical protein